MRILDRSALMAEMKAFEFDPAYLDRYLDFLESTNVPENGPIHHILPVSLFPRLQSLFMNPWNGLELSHRDHFLAHYLLYRLFPASPKMRSAFVCIARMWFKALLASDFEDYLLLEASTAYEILQTQKVAQVKGRVWVHLPGAKAIMVPKQDAPSLLNNGYEKGRGFNPNEGLVWVHSGTEMKRIPLAKVPEFTAVGYVLGNGLSGSKNPFFGKTLSTESRKRKGHPAWNKGKSWSAEVKEKFRKAKLTSHPAV